MESSNPGIVENFNQWSSLHDLPFAPTILYVDAKPFTIQLNYVIIKIHNTEYTSQKDINNAHHD